jgi:hypothetical protein
MVPSRVSESDASHAKRSALGHTPARRGRASAGSNAYLVLHYFGYAEHLVEGRLQEHLELLSQLSEGQLPLPARCILGRFVAKLSDLPPPLAVPPRRSQAPDPCR